MKTALTNQRKAKTCDLVHAVVRSHFPRLTIASCFPANGTVARVRCARRCMTLRTNLCAVDILIYFVRLKGCSLNRDNSRLSSTPTLSSPRNDV